MDDAELIATIEDLAMLIGRLDTRLSLSPLADAWHVRATIQAACNLAEVDGTPTRPEDILAIMCGSPLPSPEAYGPAIAGFAHWRRCMARIDLSPLGERLIGRRLSPAAQRMEEAEDRAAEALIDPDLRQLWSGMGATEPPDAFAARVAERTLETLRSGPTNGARLATLATTLHQALQDDPDPEYYGRVDLLRGQVNAEIDKAFASGMLNQRGAIERAELIKEAIRWEMPSHRGACFSVVPDWLQHVGLSRLRLSCLTGATKRLAMERRHDERALRGFLNRLLAEVRDGLAVLDALELLLAEMVTAPVVREVERSQLPEVVFAFLVLPATDAKWLEIALDLHERAARRFVKQLGDAGLIAHWSERRHFPVDGQRTREIKLWAAQNYSGHYQRALRQGSSGLPASPTLQLDPQTIVERSGDDDVARPMSAVLAAFDGEMVDLDRQFGRLWPDQSQKNRSPEKPVERDLGRVRSSGSSDAVRGLRGLIRGK